MTTELWFHLAEIIIMIFGLAAPALYAAFKLGVLLKNFPPHRHVNGTILYPDGYEPTHVERYRQI